MTGPLTFGDRSDETQGTLVCSVRHPAGRDRCRHGEGSDRERSVILDGVEIPRLGFSADGPMDAERGDSENHFTTDIGVPVGVLTYLRPGLSELSNGVCECH